jgi:hypothetical protein
MRLPPAVQGSSQVISAGRQWCRARSGLRTGCVAGRAISPGRGSSLVAQVALPAGRVILEGGGEAGAERLR